MKSVRPSQSAHAAALSALATLPLLAAALSLALPSAPVLAAQEVNLYSARKEDLIKPLLDRFTEQNRHSGQPGHR